MITRDCLDTIIGKASLVDVAAKLGIELKRSGVQWTGKSPFTNEKTGSFQLNETKQIWKCFSSGKGGGGYNAAVSLVMEVKGLTWYDSIVYLANAYNVPLEHEDASPEQAKQRDEIKAKRDDAEKAMQMALSYYAGNRGDEAFVQWMEARKLTADDVDIWGLGWAPHNAKHLTTELQRKGLYATGVEIGLIKDKSEGGQVKIYDTLRSRITIPIKDVFGRVIGLAGRFVETAKSDKNPPKFVNPSESFYYQKSKVLYGLNEASKAIRQRKEVMIVEGYADVWALHKAGYTNTVAHCGKFVTQEQLRILRQLCDKLVFVLEDEEAISGFEKCVKDALKSGFSVYVVDLRLDGKKQDADDLWKNCLRDMLVMDAGSDDNLDGVRELFGKRIEAATKLGITFTLEERKGTWSIPDQREKTKAHAYELLGCMSPSVLDTYVEVVARLFAQWSAEADYRMKLAELEQALEDHAIDERTFKLAKTKAFKKIAEHSGKWDKMVKDIRVNVAKLAKLGSGDKSAASNNDERVVQWDDDELMPEWVNEDDMKHMGFVQRFDGNKFYPKGIYFPHINGLTPVYKGVHRAANYTIEPLYHIVSMANSRRMVRIDNGAESTVIDLPDKAMISQSVWEEVMINRGNYTSTQYFAKYHFTKLRNYVSNAIVKAMEVSTLGWQPKGEFFSWANAVACYDGETKSYVVKHYDQSGIVEVGGKKYMSPAVSEFAKELDDYGQNPYENDLYLSYKEGEIGFAQWANQFMQVYDDHGAFGVAFAILSINKDVVYKMKQKMPLLYLYGPKGSGKSAFGESLQNLFFSGTNSDGRLIQAVNMTPGMVTPFALYNALSRVRNCFRLFNEYDPNSVDQSFRGMFKGAYDGEGRERGAGEGYKKTEIQKVLGTIGLAGQYLDMADDGALMSRSINLSFSDTRNRSRTEEQKAEYRRLMEWEGNGLASAILDLIGHRSEFEARMDEVFKSVKSEILAECRKLGKRNPEERLLNNYSLLVTVMRIAKDVMPLQIRVDDFQSKCVVRMIELSNLLSTNNVLSVFWRHVELLSQDDQIQHGKHYTMKLMREVRYREAGGNQQVKTYLTPQMVIVVQLSKLMGAYEKEMRSRGHKHTISESTLLEYLKDQSYYIGALSHFEYSNELRTSGHALDYNGLCSAVGINLDHSNRPATPEPAGETGEELPF